jgi:hypothetical protein
VVLCRLLIQAALHSIVNCVHFFSLSIESGGLKDKRNQRQESPYKLNITLWWLRLRLGTELYFFRFFFKARSIDRRILQETAVSNCHFIPFVCRHCQCRPYMFLTIPLSSIFQTSCRQFSLRPFPYPSQNYKRLTRHPYYSSQMFNPTEEQTRLFSFFPGPFGGLLPSSKPPKANMRDKR